METGRGIGMDQKRCVIKTRAVGCHFGVVGMVVRLHDNEVIAECAMTRPMGCEEAALDDAYVLATSLNYSVVKRG